MKKVLMFFAVASCTALAQITITSSDVGDMFAVGNSTTIHEDTLQSSVDIGSPGGGNNWDFTMLVSALQVSLESIDPATSPYINDFPGANICTYSLGSAGGEQIEIWSYSILNGTFDNLGNAMIISSQPGFLVEIRNDPYRRTFEHPMTINSQWSHTYTQTMWVNGTPLNPSSVTLSAVVDAYGTMTIPGGASYEALRIRDEITISGLTSVSYNFVAKNGAQVSVHAVDSNPPNSGAINADGTSYSGAMTTTGVEQISGLPNDYTLSQNYPNPFNPTTNIEYSITEESFVELKVFDVLGNEIVTLVNQEQSAGIYRADFNAANLPSGMYFARITANEYTQVVKMTLLK
jgi:hypothetical protein